VSGDWIADETSEWAWLVEVVTRVITDPVAQADLIAYEADLLHAAAYDPTRMDHILTRARLLRDAG